MPWYIFCASPEFFLGLCLLVICGSNCWSVFTSGICSLSCPSIDSRGFTPLMIGYGLLAWDEDHRAPFIYSHLEVKLSFVQLSALLLPALVNTFFSSPSVCCCRSTFCVNVLFTADNIKSASDMEMVVVWSIQDVREEACLEKINGEWKQRWLLEWKDDG